MATIPDANVNVSVYAPYERFFIKLLETIDKVIDGQSPQVKDQLWRMYIEDVQAWRKFWSSFHIDLGIGAEPKKP